MEAAQLGPLGNRCEVARRLLSYMERTAMNTGRKRGTGEPVVGSTACCGQAANGLTYQKRWGCPKERF